MPQVNYEYPPTLQAAKKHALAMRIFRGQLSNQQCKCCHRKIGQSYSYKKQLFYPLQQLKHLGPGILLLFTQLSNCILFLFLLTLTYTSYTIYYNIIYSQQCNLCSFLFKISLMIDGAHIDFLQNQSQILLIFIIISFLLLQTYRYIIFLVIQKDININCLASNYSIILQNLPIQTNKQDIQNMINIRLSKLNQNQRIITGYCKVAEIIISNSLQQYNKVVEENINSFKSSIQNAQHYNFVQKSLPQPTQSGSFAIVIFQYILTKKFFIQQPLFCDKLRYNIWPFKMIKNKFQIKQHNITIRNAPQPQEINWQNAHINLINRFQSNKKSTLVTISIIIINLILQITFGYIHQLYSQSMSLSFVAALIMVLSNYIMAIFLTIFTKKQRKTTQVHSMSILIIRIFSRQIINSLVILIICLFIIKSSQIILMNFLVESIIFLHILHHSIYNIGLFLIKYMRIDLKFNQNKQIMTQLQLNKQQQGPSLHLEYKYCYMLFTMWLTGFFCFFAPIIVFISFLGLLINYLLQKQLFRIAYSTPGFLGSTIPIAITSLLLDYFPLTLCISCFMSYLCYYSTSSTLIIILLVFSFLLSISYIFIPMDTINNFFKEQAKIPVLRQYSFIQDQIPHKYLQNRKIKNQNIIEDNNLKPKIINNQLFKIEDNQTKYLFSPKNQQSLVEIMKRNQQKQTFIEMKNPEKKSFRQYEFKPSSIGNLIGMPFTKRSVQKKQYENNLIKNTVAYDDPISYNP